MYLFSKPDNLSYFLLNVLEAEVDVHLLHLTFREHIRYIYIVETAIRFYLLPLIYATECRKDPAQKVRDGFEITTSFLL